MVSKYGIMDHFTLNLRPKEYFQLAPNMRTAYIELCIYVMSKSVTYRLGGHIPIWYVSMVSMVSMHNGPLYRLGGHIPISKYGMHNGIIPNPIFSQSSRLK